ncbi:MAG: hypothetical protein HYV09_37530 [Deltaproteobacteria bacterium]|nr:hypothetical protein [Deltaproteobacteria bacterium]
MAAQPHRFRFFRAGGFDQVRLDRGADLVALDELDQKLWAALSCPVEGLEFDERTLALLDTDNDGRIRAPEVIAAAKWAGALLAKPEDLVTGGDTIALTAFADDHDEAKKVLASARQILRDLGKEDEGRISLADVTDTAKIFAQTKFNGDGIVPPASAADEPTKKAIEDIIECVGGEPDRSGAPGVSLAKVKEFFDAATAFDAWWKRAEADAAVVLPLGDRTSAAVSAYQAVKAKVDDWFTRSRLAAFDARAIAPLNCDEAEYAALALKVLSAKATEVSGFPLARIAPDAALPLETAINPAWADAMAALRAEVVEPLLGARPRERVATLTAAEWASLSAKLAPYEAWSAAKEGAVVEKLGLTRVRELLSGGAREAIEALIASDEALRQEAEGIALVEKIVRLHRDLFRFLQNFVSFTDFYSRKRKAVFQAGRLYLDQRSCDLCVRVRDASAHAAIATLSKTYLVYCECTRKADGKKMTIAAAFTGGDSDALMVGRNGLFYDRKGDDWDATIVKIVEHPISIRQAFLMPYKRIGSLVGDQIEKIASARDKALHDKAAVSAAGAAQTAEGAAAAPPAAAPPTAREQAFDVAKFAGVFAAIGLAIGALGSVLAAVGAGFLALRWWQMPLAVAGIILLISGPSMIIAWVKLRQRSLGPILDANGWAVNTRAKMNIPFGASLTAVAALPPNAERSLDDPFEQKKTPWVLYLSLLVLVAAAVWAWRHGLVQRWLKM